MFTPTKDEVRRFFRETWRKHRAAELLSPIEAMALDWIIEHPEYHEELAQTGEEPEYRVEDGRTNPFLHLSMHLAIAEQLSIDQPPGIRAAYERLVRRRGDAHRAAHAVIEMGDDERQAQGARQFGQYGEEGERVRSAGAGDQDGRSAGDPAGPQEGGPGSPVERIGARRRRA